jgi:hypothetical protein
MFKVNRNFRFYISSGLFILGIVIQQFNLVFSPEISERVFWVCWGMGIGIGLFFDRKEKE